jgi:hypothetical protein
LWIAPSSRGSLIAHVLADALDDVAGSIDIGKDTGE